MASKESSSLFRITLLSITLVLIGGSFLVYFGFYQTARHDYFVERAVRALDAVADDLVERAENFSHILEFESRRSCEPERVDGAHPRVPTCPLRVQTSTGPRMLGVARVEPRNETAAPPPRCDGADARLTRFRVGAMGAETLLEVYFGPCRTEPDGRVVALETRLSLRDLLSPAAGQSLFDHLAIARPKNGEVVYNLGTTLPILTDLGALTAPAAEDAGSPASGWQPGLPMHATVLAHEIAGADYTVVLAPLRFGWNEEPVGDATAASGTQWILAGLIRNDKLNLADNTVSQTAFGLWFLVLILGCLAWPFLKMWLIGPRERLFVHDLFLLATAALLGAALVTLLFLDIYAYQALKWRMDGALEYVSTQIRASFRQELKAAYDELQEHTGRFVATVDRPARRGCPCRSEPAGGGPGTGLCPDRCVIERLQEPHDGQSFFPPFEVVFWLDEHGHEVGQWTYRAELVPPIRVPDRGYFRNALERRLWRFEDSANPQDPRLLFVEPVRDRSQGTVLSVLSFPFAAEQTETGDTPSRIRVAVLAKRLQSLIYQALPPEFGFVVVDADGRVLFHADESHRLVENLFVETEDNQDLKAAVTARREDLFRLNYHGSAHRFHVHPLPDTPWTLITYWDMSLLRTLNFELLMTCAFLAMAYCALYSLLIVSIRLIAPRYQFSWIWPVDKRRTQHVECTLGLLAILLAAVLGAGWLDSQATLGLILIMPLLTVGYLYRKLDSGRRRKTHGIRVAFLFGAIVLAILLFTVSWWLVLFLATTLASLWLLHVGKPWIAARWGGLVHRLGNRLPQKPFWCTVLARLNRPKISFLGDYFVLVFLALMIFAVVPSAAIFRDAFTVHIQALARYQQLEFARSVERQQILRQRDRQRIGPAWRDAAPAASSRLSCVEPGQFHGAFHYYGWNDRACEAQSGATDFDCSPQIRKLELNKELDQLIESHFTGVIPAYLQAYNDASRKFRNLLFDRASDDRWCWRMDERSSPPTLQFDSKGADSPLPIRLVSHPVRLRELVGLCPKLAGVMMIAAVVVLVALYRLLESTLNRFFGLDQPDLETGPADSGNRRCEAPQAICGRRLLIRPDAEHLDEMERLIRHAGWVRVIDLGTCSGPESLKDCPKHALKNLEFLLVLRVDYHRLTDRQWRQAILEFLEWIVLRNAKPNVIVATDVDLLPSLFALGEAMPASERNNGPSDHDGAIGSQPDRGELARWSELFSRFEKIRFPLAQPSGEGKTRNQAVLEHECGWHPELAPIGGQISRLEGFEDFSKHQVIQQVVDRADAAYRKLWMSCSNEERLMLVNVARGALVNPRNTVTLHRLLRRGLIRRHGFELPCESFRHFVLAAVPPEQLHQWQQAAERRSLWTALKIPLALILVVVAGFIFFTQREVFDATVAFAAALVAGLSALLGLLSLVRSNGDDASGNS